MIRFLFLWILGLWLKTLQGRRRILWHAFSQFCSCTYAIIPSTIMACAVIGLTSRCTWISQGTFQRKGSFKGNFVQQHSFEIILPIFLKLWTKKHARSTTPQHRLKALAVKVAGNSTDLHGVTLCMLTPQKSQKRISSHAAIGGFKGEVTVRGPCLPLPRCQKTPFAFPTYNIANSATWRTFGYIYLTHNDCRYTTERNALYN